MSWVLIMVFVWNSAVAIPGYSSKEECEAAAAQWKSLGVRTGCIPGPQR